MKKLFKVEELSFCLSKSKGSVRHKPKWEPNLLYWWIALSPSFSEGFCVSQRRRCNVHYILNIPYYLRARIMRAIHPTPLCQNKQTAGGAFINRRQLQDRQASGVHPSSVVFSTPGRVLLSPGSVHLLEWSPIGLADLTVGDLFMANGTSIGWHHMKDNAC